MNPINELELQLGANRVFSDNRQYGENMKPMNENVVKYGR